MRLLVPALVAVLAAAAAATGDSNEGAAYVSKDLPAGAVDGHFSIEQLNNWMGLIAAAFSSTATAVWSIGTSLEGRPINAMCIGVCVRPNPQVPAPAPAPAPAVLLTGQHHAREPESTMAIVIYVDALLRAFVDKDPSAVALLSTRQLWIIPLVNPDGYAYNEQHYPRGGGMVRKNRRRTHSCTNAADEGVDLNRNYPVCFDHFQDDDGASSDKCREDYRGPAPFSEPETVAVRDFIEQPHQVGDGQFRYTFRFALNFHSYGRYVNIPYSCQFQSMAPQRLQQYKDVAALMCADNGWLYGRSWEERELYPVNGEASDWMEAAHGIMAMSPEVGPQFDAPYRIGFWPHADNVYPLAAEAFTPIDVVYWLAGVKLTMSDFAVTGCSVSLSVSNTGHSAAPSSATSVTVAVFGDGWHAISTVPHAPLLASSASVTVAIQLPDCSQPRLRRVLSDPHAVQRVVIVHGNDCVVYSIGSGGAAPVATRALASDASCALPQPQVQPQPTPTPAPPQPSASPAPPSASPSASPTPAVGGPDGAGVSPGSGSSLPSPAPEVWSSLSPRTTEVVGFVCGLVFPLAGVACVVALVVRSRRRAARYQQLEVSKISPDTADAAASQGRTPARGSSRRAGGGGGRRQAASYCDTPSVDGSDGADSVDSDVGDEDGDLGNGGPVEARFPTAVTVTVHGGGGGGGGGGGRAQRYTDDTSEDEG